MAYIFGGSTGETAESLKRKREWVQSMLESAVGQQPQNIGDGIAVVGRALAGRLGQAVLNKREREGTAAAMKAAGGNSYIRDLLLGNTGGGGAEISGTSGASTLPGSAGRDKLGPLPKDIAPIADYIREAAAKRGIDPDTAVRVARSEGLAKGVWQSNYHKNGKRETSYGPYQLLVGGGLGDKFIRQTGLDPRDPSTVYQQVDFALDQAKAGGWSPWYGAAKVGVGNWDGIQRGNNALPGGEGNDMLMDGWGQPDPNRPGHGINTQTGAPSSFSQPDPARYGPPVAPKGDRLPDPNAMPQFNPMMAQGPLGPQMAPQMAQGMPQQAMNSPAAVPPPNAMNPDPMQTAAVPQPMMRPRGIVSPRAEDNGYVSGPGAAMQQPGGQGGGLLGRLLSRQPMPQAAQAVSGTGGQATAPGGGGNDELMQMYALLDNPYLPESYRAALLEALKQKQQQADPSYQADLAYKQAQTRALENPDPQFIPGKDGSIFRADKTTGNVEQVYGGKPDKFRQLTPEEITQRKLDPAFSYQIGADDKVYKIGGDGTTVNIDQKAESEFDKELAKRQAGTFDTMATEGLNARADLGIIGELGTLLQGQGGTFTGVSGMLAKYGIGGEGIDDIQAAQALINKLVPTQRSPGSGSMSDRDVELFTRSLPSLWNTPGGNEKILNVMRGLAQYKQAQGEIADMVLTGEMTRQEARVALRKLPNPLAEFGASGSGGEIERDGYKVREVP